MVSSMPPEKEGNDNNVVGVSALKRDLSPVPTADKETVPENKQTSWWVIQWTFDILILKTRIHTIEEPSN